MAAEGPEALHAELDPDVAATIHPNDRKRIARSVELQRAGLEPPRVDKEAASCGRRASPPDAVVGLTIDGDELAHVSTLESI